MEPSPLPQAPEPRLPMIDHAPAEPTQRGGSTGSVIAILLIVFLLVMGAFYVWGQRLSEERAVQQTPVGSQ